jgi:hypothetical protein
MQAKELIDIIAPEHSRTSCSDENIANGFYFEYDSNTISNKYIVGCSRCALLQLSNGKAVDSHNVIDGVIIVTK